MFGNRSRKGKAREKVKWKRGGRTDARNVVSFNVLSPADVKLSAYNNASGTYLFEDGSIGQIIDAQDEFNPCDYYDDDEDFDEDEYWERIEKGVKEGSDLIVGSLFTDRFDRKGVFVQGDSYAYTEGKLLRDQLDEDGTPYPIRRIPDIFFDAGDYGRDAKKVYRVLDLYLAGEIDKQQAEERLAG